MLKQKINDYFSWLDATTLGKGSRLLKENAVVVTEHNLGDQTIRFKIRSEANPEIKYNVQFNYDDEVKNNLTASCNCPFFDSNKYCKHTAAASLYVLQQKYQIVSSDVTIAEQRATTFQTAKPIYEPQSPTLTVALTDLVPQNINRFRQGVAHWDFDVLVNPRNYSIGGLYDRQIFISFKTQHDYRPQCEVSLEADADQNITFQKGTCGAKILPCKHQRAAVGVLCNRANNIADAVIDLKAVKEKIKANFHIPATIPFEDILMLTTFGGTISAKLTDPSLQLLSPSKNQATTLAQIRKYEQVQVIEQDDEVKNVLVFVWEWDSDLIHHTPLNISAVVGKMKKDGQMSKKFTSIQQYSISNNLPFPIDTNQAAVIEQVEKIYADSRLQYYEREQQRFLTSNAGNTAAADPDDLFLLEQIRRDTMEVYEPLTHQQNYKASSNGRLSAIQLSTDSAHIILQATNDENFIWLELNFEINGIEQTNAKPFTPFFVQQEDTLHPVHSQLVPLLHLFNSQKKLKWFATQWQEVYNNFIAPYLQMAKFKNNTSFALPIEKILAIKNITTKVYLKEQDRFFLLVPAFVYEHENGNTEIEMDGTHFIRFEKKQSIDIIERNLEFETAAQSFFKTLHPNFEKQLYNHFYFLPEQEVMQKNWLLHTIKQLTENGIEVMGMKQLKKYNYNANSPSIRIAAGSGIDWFDLKVQVTFGEQELKITDLRSAILNNQAYVKLGDGSIGILPEEWLQKYQPLFAATQIKKDKLQLNRFQVTMIDELYSEIDNNQALLDLSDKIYRLKNFEGIKNHELPTNVKATLRNYQQTGFEWLCFLDEYGWGGCLADDMGLGKTLQMLTFFQHKVNTQEKFTALVVVPTSLIFNWENEIKKFTPDIKYLLHTGIFRKKDVAHFADFNIVITSYGLLRRDIETMQNFEFDYIVLDESQAIKNPLAQTSKSVKLLKAKNRLVMTGTPVENSTFDLYSQFDFLNPGMLGSLEAFKSNFANQIDGEKNEEASEKLRKQIYPFILSRKKNQVAKELPEKTETIIYCEMDEAQQRIYKNYKLRIRNDLESKIDEQGMAKSSLMILAAFTKLRQICNSPALLSNEDEDYSKTEGVKLTVLMEQVEALVQENHKVLVFSFFTSMLSLVEQKLNEKNISFVKITGDTTNRQARVDEFQNDESIKVFLISLKAGGTGLNLTAADYVFLIDPWWNPAVEQQAIDRTHRIGQTKHIFAYKLICKNSIEEKILELQQKKKSLVTDLISIENGSFKKLTKDDVMAILD